MADSWRALRYVEPAEGDEKLRATMAAEKRRARWQFGGAPTIPEFDDRRAHAEARALGEQAEQGANEQAANVMTVFSPRIRSAGSVPT